MEPTPAGSLVGAPPRRRHRGARWPPTTTPSTASTRAQQPRIDAGELDPDRPHPPGRRLRLYVGDEIATRRNDRHLRTDRGEMVRNRATGPSPPSTPTASHRHRTHRHRPPPRRLRGRRTSSWATPPPATPPRAAPSTTPSSSSTAHRRPRRVRPHDPRPAHQPRLRRPPRRGHRRRRVRPLSGQRLDRRARPRPPRRTHRPLHRVGPGCSTVLCCAPSSSDAATSKPTSTRLSPARTASPPRSATPGGRPRCRAGRRRAPRPLPARPGAVDDYDRPLRRRRHDCEVAAARRDLTDLPRRLTSAELKFRPPPNLRQPPPRLTTTPPPAHAATGHRGRARRARRPPRRRPTHPHPRHPPQQPGHIVDVFGPRPLGRRHRMGRRRRPPRPTPRRLRDRRRRSLGAIAPLLHPPVFAASCEAVARLTGPLAPPDMQRSIELEGVGNRVLTRATSTTAWRPYRSQCQSRSVVSWCVQSSAAIG